MHHSRHTTDLCGRSLGLGCLSLSQKHGRSARIGASVIVMEDHSHLHSHRFHALGCRCDPLPRTAKVLPTTTWTHHIFLLVDLPTQDHPLVLPDCPDPELLPFRTIRSKLDVSIQQPGGTDIRNRATDLAFLRRILGRLLGSIRSTLQDTFMDLASLRDRSRRTTMGTNLVGNIQHWILPPLGWWSNNISTAKSKSLALARHTRCNPGSRSRHDPPGDIDKSSRRIHVDRRASSWIDRYDGSTGLCTEQDRTRTYLARYLQGCRRDVAGLVLDWIGLQFERMCWIFHVFQEGTVEQALGEGYLSGGYLRYLRFYEAFLSGWFSCVVVI